MKTDKYGWKYYEKLPQGYRLAKMGDFHLEGIKKIGMLYLIKRFSEDHYEIHHLKEYTTSQYLKPFLDHEMVFIKSI